jgi:predicted Zn-dependent peptidase
MVPALEKRFGTWRSNSPGLEAKPHVKVTFPESQKVYVVPEAGASQAVIYVAVPAPGRLEAGYEETVAAANLLGADFASRLNSVIREEKGYSYGVGATMTDALPENGAVIVNVPVEVDTTGAALQEVFNGFASLIEVPVTDIEVHRTRTSYATGLASVAETAQTLFGYLTYAEGQGMTLADNQGLLERMTQLDLKNVQAQAQALASLDQAVIVIAGDADVILPQLEAIGIEGVVVVAADGP